MPGKVKLSAEASLIARHFRPIAKHPGAFMLTDDAAAIAPPPGCDLVMTTDGVIAGVHVFADDPPDLIARKALRMNLSVLAAKRTVRLVAECPLSQAFDEAERIWEPVYRSDDAKEGPRAFRDRRAPNWTGR